MSSAPKTGSTRVTTGFILLLCALTASVLAGGALPNQQAHAATGPGCTAVTLEPTVSTVRARGMLQLTGRPTGRICSSSTTVAPGEVVIRVKRGSRWPVTGRTRLTSAGAFTTCARIRVPKQARSALLRAVTSLGSSSAVRVRVRHRARTQCSTETAEPVIGATVPPPSDPPAVGDPPPSDPRRCPLLEADSEIGYTVSPACTTVLSDISADPSPLGIWGRIDCEEAGRHQRIAVGGDSGATGSGGSQDNDSFRRLTAYDGDDWWGERCELGRNDHRYGPTAVYYEGMRRLTYMSVRLPDNFPLAANSWQLVMQMKQTQPASNGGGTPVIELDAYGNRWRLRNSKSAGPSSDSNQLWSAPAAANTWTRFAFDIVYSQSAELGSIKAYVDLNGDGDFADPDEQSARIRTHTLKYETTASASFGASESIPSHLRVGIYHNPSIPCPTGCSVDIDNVQILAP